MTMRRVVPVLLSIIVSGCSFFSRSQSRIYSLDRIPASAPLTNVRGLPFGIGGVELPPGFDRREIVVKKAGQQLEVRSNELWQATLQDLVLHTLAYDLASRLPAGMLILPGQSKPATMRTIDAIFEELAAGPANSVVLDGTWVVREPGRADVTHHERISIDIASLDSAAVATGTSQALAAFADRIANGAQ